MTTLTTWAAAFLFAVALDFVAARWTLALAARQPLAVLWSGLCFLLGFGGYKLCYDSLDALLPSCCGHALGTWLAMRLTPAGRVK